MTIETLKPFQMGRETMTGLSRDLYKLAESGNEIIVGLIGAGEMGTDLILQIGRMKGMRLVPWPYATSRMR